MKPVFNRFFITCFGAAGAISSSAFAQTTWNGSVDGSWAATGNWSAGIPDSADVVTYGAGLNVGTAVANGTQTLDGSYSVSGFSVGNNAASPIVINSGTGTNTLTIGANGIILNSGSGGSFTANADLILGASQTWTTGNGRNITANNVNLGSSNLNTNVAGTGAITINGVISGSGSLTRAGGGTALFTLAGSNSYTGGTTVSAGTLVLGHASDTLADTGAVTVSGGTLSIGTNSDTVGAVTLTSGNITGSGTLTGTSYSVSAGTISAKLAGTGVNFSKSTAGVVAIDNADNSFSGTVILVGGTTNINKLANGGSTSSLGSGSSAIVLNGGTLATSATGVGGSTNRTIEMRAGAGLSSNGTGAISFTAANVTQTLTASARTMTLSGTNTGDNTLGSILGDSGTGANITTLTKSGTGTWVLTGANTYTGGTIINQGVLRAAGSGVLGGKTGSTADANNIVFGTTNANATLEFETNANLGAADQIRFRNTGGTAGSGALLKYIGTTAQVVSKAIQCDSSIGVRLSSDSVGGSVEFSGSWASTSGNRPIYLGGSGTGDNTISGSITSNGSGTLTKVDAGKWILTGANTYTGVTTITSGTLQLGNGGTTGKISTSSAITNNGNLAINRSNAVAQGTDFSSAAITGTGSVTAAGTGTITLSAANSYSGGTTVNAGADLRINGAQTGAGTVTVAATGKLGGSGSVIGGINVSGVLAPGNSIESLGGGALSFTTGSTYAFELQTNLYASTPGFAGDLAYSSGTLSIASGTILTLQDLATSTALLNGSKLTLISSLGAWNGGLFSYDAGAGLVSLADDSKFTLGANEWLFNYNDTSGGPNFLGNTTGATSFVTMTVVPEPAAVLLGGIGTLILLRRRRLK